MLFFSLEDFDSEGITVKVVQEESLYKLLVLLKLFLSKKTRSFRQKWLQIMQSTSGQQYFSPLVTITVAYFLSALHKTAGDVYLLFSTG